MGDSDKHKLSYRDAGVDIDAGNRLVERIRDVAARTRRPEVLGNLGGFGALCELPAGYRQPVLVSGTDGVGTKLRLAMDLNRHDFQLEELMTRIKDGDHRLIALQEEPANQISSRQVLVTGNRSQRILQLLLPF